MNTCQPVCRRVRVDTLLDNHPIRDHIPLHTILESLKSITPLPPYVNAFFLLSQSFPRKFSRKVFTEINFYKRPGGQSKAEPGRPERGLTGRGGFLLLRTISHFTYEMVNKQSETARRAVSGSAGQDVRCFRLVRLNTIYPFH